MKRISGKEIRKLKNCIKTMMQILNSVAVSDEKENRRAKRREPIEREVPELTPQRRAAGLKEFMDAYHITNREIAARSGLSEETVAMILTDYDSNPSLSDLCKIETALNEIKI